MFWPTEYMRYCRKVNREIPEDEFYDLVASGKISSYTGGFFIFSNDESCFIQSCGADVCRKCRANPENDFVCGRTVIPILGWIESNYKSICCLNSHIPYLLKIDEIEYGYDERSHSDNLNYLEEEYNDQSEKINKKIEKIEKRLRSYSGVDHTIYLCKNLDNGYIKIGFTTNTTPTFREGTLQSKDPNVLFMRVYKGIKKDEKILHEMFEANRVRGEWFDLLSDDISTIDSYFDEKYIVFNRSTIKNKCRECEPLVREEVTDNA